MKILLSVIALFLLSTKFGNATNSSDNGPGVALTRQAIEMGMVPMVLGELWRTKQPVVISKPNSKGELITTTYDLSPDGQRILTTTVNDGQQTGPKSEVTTTTVSSVSPQTDWEYLPSSIGYRPTFTTNPVVSNWPSFEDSIPQWTIGQSAPSWPSFGFPAGVTPQTSTKTEQDDQGRTVTTTIKSYRSPGFTSILAHNWPSFEFPTGVKPEVSTKTELDDQGRTVTTTTKTYKGTLPHNNWSPESSPGSWQPRPNVFEAQRPSWLDRPIFSERNPQPRPAGIPNGAHPISTLPLAPQPTSSTSPRSPTEPPTPKTIATINVNDLPSYRTTNELPTSTRVTSYTGTYSGAAPPTTADLAPSARGMLHNAGITDDDIRNAQESGGDIVRNRVMPDGRVIKTTFRVNTRLVPSPSPSPSPEALLPTAPPRRPTQQTAQSPEVLPYQPQSAFPSRANQQPDNSINDFLSQVNLRPSDILAQNGEVVKTIVDKDGRVLSAKFVLSTVKGDEETNGQGQTGQPTK